MKNQTIRIAIFLFVSVFIALCRFSVPAMAQISTTELIAKTDQFNQQFPQEKLYLHLDRPSYWAGDDIWFKAYLKNSAIKNSNVYVELLDSAGTVVYKDICWAMNGFAYGDMTLENTLPSGMYQLRAYTSWMRNFDEQWFYRRDLVIWNLRDKQRTPEFQKINTRKINLDFMPESGTLLAGVNNTVAFKVTDENGKGLDVEGVVLDENRNTIAEINSDYKGMGSFNLTPQSGKQYLAEVTIAGSIPKSKILPEAVSSGIVLQYQPDVTDQLQFEINAANQSGSTFYLIGQSEGKVCYEKEIALTNGNTKLAIDKSDFPTGIVRFTLFNNKMLPKSERLVFVDNQNQITVNIKPDKDYYSPREKITLDLQALGKGETPVLSNLSFSAYHVETTNETKTYPENIMTRFLLSSELKGKIEEPAYYFKDNNLATIKALDNVMLTHGYRYFSWEEVLENKQPEIAFQPDSSIEIKGKVVSLLFRRPVADGKVTMMTTQSLLTVNEQQTDSEGNFKFTNLYFYDSLHVALQALNSNGNKNTDIILDDKVYTSPQTGLFPTNYLYKKDAPTQTVTYMSEMSPEMLNRKWRLSDTILLQELNVAAKRLEKGDGYVRPYLDADHIINVQELRSEYMDLNDMLESSGYVRNFMQSSVGDGGMSVYIDGVYDYTERFNNDLPLSWIDKIEFVKVSPVPGGWEKAIYVWTKRGKPNERMLEPPGVFPLDVSGYALTRVFYSPAYDGSEALEENNDDYRSTLYWDPAIETNYQGNAEVSYYNSDQTGEVKVIVEGITYDGKLCRGVATYNVGYDDDMMGSR